MKWSECLTLRGLKKTVDGLMSARATLSYWSFCTRRSEATRSHAVMEHWNWKQRMPRGLLFIISLYVVQISQDMAAVSLETCLPCSIQAWNIVMCAVRNAEEKDSQWKLQSREMWQMSDYSGLFYLNMLKENKCCAMLKISPIARQSSKWEGGEISRR